MINTNFSPLQVETAHSNPSVKFRRLMWELKIGEHIVTEQGWRVVYSLDHELNPAYFIIDDNDEDYMTRKKPETIITQIERLGYDTFGSNFVCEEIDLDSIPNYDYLGYYPSLDLYPDENTRIQSPIFYAIEQVTSSITDATATIFKNIFHRSQTQWDVS